MKKIALMIAALGATLAFTACQESADDHPTLGKTDGQVVEFLNVPEMANMALQITNENKEGSIHMTCSQPTEYGFAAPVNYEVQIALNEDFKTPMVEGCPAAVVLPTSFHDCAEINPSNEEIARAMCEMLNIESNDQIPTPYYKLYMRLISNVATTPSGSAYEGTTLVSNTVSINQVSVGYLAIIVPGLPTGIYLRGSMNGWAAPAEWEFLTSAVSNVYELNDIYIAKDEEFKVADAGWSTVNYGAGAGTFEFNKPYELEYNAGNIVMPANFSGNVTLTISGGKYVVLFEAAEPDVPGQPTGVYLLGDFNGWGADNASQFYTTDIKHVWVVQNVTITPGGFKIADTDWSEYNLGGEGDIVANELFALIPGGGNINLTSEFTGTATMSVKGGNYYLKLTPAE